ncbi:MAG: single-stranded DNA-binding protein [Bacteroidales bacterium]|nr:single-stranded DNA-binding protein [Bacteroidales bacterium]
MSINKVILLGNVGKEPDIRYFEQNRGVANFTLATTERAHTGRNDQQIPERTEWHNIVVRGGLVQVVERFVHKGSKLFLEGKIRTRSYVDREGRDRFVTEIVVDVLEILSRRDGGNNNHNNDYQNQTYGGLGESTYNGDNPDDMGDDFMDDNAPF